MIGAVTGSGPVRHFGGHEGETVRARDLGLRIGLLEPGDRDAITDIPGVLVGHTTLISGDGPLVVGQGPVRTGVTIVVPHEDHVFTEPVFAGCHRLNGNGELTGLEWVRESGLLGGVIGITNTHSVGVVRDALVAHAAAENAGKGVYWSLPVVGETYDGALNDIDGQHVRGEHVDAALASATRAVAEGNVGGGTGMVLHEFKGGIGTASRRVPGADGGWTVGALVQANYGSRELMRVDGVPVGEAIPVSEIPSAWDQMEAIDPMVSDAQPGMAGRQGPGGGSIIVVIATDAPLLPHQCQRIAQRAGLGLARMGSIASNGSGDLFIAFATGNRGLGPLGTEHDARRTVETRTVVDKAMSPLFLATVEAVEGAVVNALLAAATMTGRDGVTAYAVDHDRLLDVMARFGRGPRARAAG